MRIRKQYKIAGPVSYSHIHAHPAASPAEMKQYYLDNDHASVPVTLTVDGIPFTAVFQGEEKLIVEGIYPDDPAFLQYLLDQALPIDQAREERVALIDRAADKVLGIIKYIFDFHRLKEYLKFSTNAQVQVAGEWADCVDRRNMIWVPAEAFLAMDRGTVAEIQALLDQGIEPLHGMKFLSKAKAEDNLRDRCLLLATAAEQSIKEYFERQGYVAYRGSNFPALYTTHLAAQSGAASPHATGIQENSTLRNRIVHHPAGDPVITGADTIRHLDAVESGILHLMTLLYPGNQTLQDLLAAVDNSRPR